MTTANPVIGVPAPPTLTRRQRVAPAVTLLLLSPIVVNVLFGAIRITFILAVLPAAAAWGLGTLIIRDLVRRRHRGWAAILLLGVALAIAEECVFLQTSLLPLIGVDPNHVYGRAFGVNWPYLLWALGYESVWAVALPILLVEWMYPERRNGPWMGSKGLVIASVVFVVAGLVRWYGWTQVFVPQNFPQWAHRPSPFTIVFALVAIGMLVVGGLKAPSSSETVRPATGAAPPPWLVAIAALGVGLAWSVLLFLAYGAAPTLPVGIPLLAGIGLAVVAILLVDRWAHRPGWQELHSLALASGALLASMSAGFLVLKGGGAPPVDFVGKAILNGIAILGLIHLGMRFRGGSD
ncbi:hypothetical protein [Aquisphaera insulae]|uniref:hypothetical protein n=1 Tax=Aquisphaera insulae TaxID=2712864 RepID=UPI0013E9FF8A|nr:hypothetical protein [Aquisphaera insulae]